MSIPKLLSPYDTTCDLVYFPRMLQKIRLMTVGTLPDELVKNLGIGFDERCARFFRLSYEQIKAQLLTNLDQTDEEVFAWCALTGRSPEPDDIEIWNGFLTRRGWRDDLVETRHRRIKESALPEDGSILTMFDYIDADEGRPLRQFLA
jgi:hypothetical protein